MRMKDVTAGMMAMMSLGASDVRRFVRNARNPAYWRKLNPQLSISGKPDLEKIQAKAISAAAKRTALEKLDSDGYFQIDPVYPGRLLNALREGIENLARANWPAPFIYVYDEPWAMKRIPSFIDLIDAILGPSHRELQNVWAHFLRPVPGAHGWQPHMDGPTLGGRVSAWFPVTDATLENGCIYIVPQNRIPDSLTENFARRATFRQPELQLLMHAARALPVKAGSILGWNFKVLHWGSVAGQTRQPRISLATEFVAADAPNVDLDNAPLDAHTSIPEFDVRLELIGRAIVAFPTFEPMMLRYRAVAQHLWHSR